MAVEYEAYAKNLVGTPLFQGMDSDEIATLLKAMSPSVRQGRANPNDNGGRICDFQLVVSSSAPNPPEAGQAQASDGGSLKNEFPYSGAGFCQVGMIMGEIPAFSKKDDVVKRTPLWVKPPMPDLDWDIECLDLTPEMVCSDLGEKAAPAQRKFLRNLLGTLAQKVVNVRRDLYIERCGWDMFALDNRRVDDGMCQLDTL